VHPAKFINGKNAPGFFFLPYKSFFFPEMHTIPFLFAVFLCFCVFRAALSPVRGFVVNG